MNDLSKKKVGDPVYGVDGREWKVTEKDSGGTQYPLTVVRGGESAVITDDGRFYMWLPPSFFSEPVRIVPAQGECDFSGYEVGDEVYGSNGKTYRLRVINEDKLMHLTTSDGSWNFVPLDGKSDDKQIFFHAPPNLVPSNPEAFRIPQHIAERKKRVDWSQVPIDTLVEVCIDITFRGDGRWQKRYFAGIEHNKPCFWGNGATSTTAYGNKVIVDRCENIRLAEGGV